MAVDLVAEGGRLAAAGILRVAPAVVTFRTSSLLTSAADVLQIADLAGVCVLIVQKLAGDANIAITVQYVPIAGGALRDTTATMEDDDGDAGSSYELAARML